MSKFHLPIRRIASGCAIALAISAVQATAQVPTQLVPAIRNFDREDPSTIPAVPKLLSQAGLYRNIGNKATRAISDTSVAAFQVNSALWSDGSHKERFISLLPGTKVIPNDTAKYAFPDGATLIKNFLIDTVYGDNSGNSRILVETRFLSFKTGPSGKKWSGLSYRWLRDQSDAVLVHPDSGMDYTHNVVLNGTRVGKRWRYPSARDCRECHKGDETTSRGTLGFITPQLNRVVNGTNQLQTLFTRGILSANPVAGKPNAHRWYGLNDTATLEQRTRSYFASNCSHCHGNNIMHTQAFQNFDYFTANKRITYQPDPNTGAPDTTGAWVGMPSISDSELRWLVSPGYPDSSVVLSKMKFRIDEHLSFFNDSQMPPLATSQPDSAALSMIENWICSLKPGTPCNKLPFLPDDTYWGEAVDPVSVRPHGKVKDPAFQPVMRRGQLSVPAHIAAAGRVELVDYQGRRVALAHLGMGMFRLPRTLTPGIYFLVAGPHRVSLNYIP